jgi:DNA polymerase-1
VRTGRMSMDDPNLQNVPIRTKMGKRIRKCFSAIPDHTWIKYDADQIEMRIFAHLAEDPQLIDAFLQARKGGPDMFTRACREIFQDPGIPKEDVRRQHTKNGFYAILYGAGTEQFAKTAGMWRSPGVVDLTAASAFLTALHGRYPGIKRLQWQIEAEARARRGAEGESYVRSFLTRRKHTADEGREYALMNYLVQGAAGEILKMKIIEADHAGLGEYMLFPVHDEIDFEVPTSDLPDVLHRLDEVMNDDTLLSVPLTWSADTGPSWGDC